MRKTMTLLTTVLILMLLGLYQASAEQKSEKMETAAPAEKESEIKIKGLDLQGLSDDQIKMLKSLLAENRMKVCYSKPILEFLEKDPPNLIASQITQNTLKGIKEGRDKRNLTLNLKRYLRRAKADPERSPETVYDINLANSPFRGPENAKVTIVEFSDFQCPYCARLYKTLDEVDEKFPDDVKHVFKNFPLERIHKAARLAAKAALAAREQGKFWDMRQKLFDNFRAINEDGVKKYAEELELDLEKFNQDLSNKSFDTLVTEDLIEGELADVRGTPSIYINGRIYRGDRSTKGFEDYIIKLLGKEKEPTTP